MEVVKSINWFQREECVNTFLYDNLDFTAQDHSCATFFFNNLDFTAQDHSCAGKSRLSVIQSWLRARPVVSSLGLMAV